MFAFLCPNTRGVLWFTMRGCSGMKVGVTTCEPGDTGKLFLPPAGPVSRMFFKVKKKCSLNTFGGVQMSGLQIELCRFASSVGF